MSIKQLIIPIGSICAVIMCVFYIGYNIGAQDTIYDCQKQKGEMIIDLTEYMKKLERQFNDCSDYVEMLEDELSKQNPSEDTYIECVE